MPISTCATASSAASSGSSRSSATARGSRGRCLAAGSSMASSPRAAFPPASAIRWRLRRRRSGSAKPARNGALWSLARVEALAALRLVVDLRSFQCSERDLESQIPVTPILAGRYSKDDDGSVGYEPSSGNNSRHEFRNGGRSGEFREYRGVPLSRQTNGDGQERRHSLVEGRGETPCA